MRTYDNIQKVTAGQEYGYTTGFLLGYPYLKERCNLIAIDFSKQRALDGDPKAIQEIGFIANLDQDRNTPIFDGNLLLMETTRNEGKEPILDFS